MLALIELHVFWSILLIHLIFLPSITLLSVFRFGSLGLSPEDARSETPQSDEERTMFSNQVKALEESKTLLANEVGFKHVL